MNYVARVSALVIAILTCGLVFSTAQAGEWIVQKLSGSAWVGSKTAQPASLGTGSVLKSGQTIRTGKNGRVFLTRDKETILVSPNSMVGLPDTPSGGLSTTILQQAGSILLTVEKRNVNHFEVQTPFLAALVKGTTFAVSVTPSGAKVNVTEGRVEVTDFRSGQITLLLPGQTAAASTSDRGGLTLSGTGKFNAIRQGTPQLSHLKPVTIPVGGFIGPNPLRRSAAKVQKTVKSRSATRLRITAPIGEVTVNFSKATNGLARSAGKPTKTANSGGDKKSNVSAWSGEINTFDPGTGGGTTSVGVSAPGALPGGSGVGASVGTGGIGVNLGIGG